MAKVSPLQSNFVGGEFSELLYGRVDSERYRSALALCKNYVPVIQGPLIRRSGTSYVSEVKSSATSTRLVSFQFSTTQAYIIEFGNLYMRFYKNNGQITEATVAITGATAANPCVITAVAHGYSTGEEVYIDDVVGMTQLNGKNYKITVLTAGTFSLQDMDGTNVNSSAYTAYSSGGTSARVYTVTTTYATADLFQLKFTQSADILYISHPLYAPRKLTRTGHTSWTLSQITFLDGPYLSTNTTTTTLTPSGGAPDAFSAGSTGVTLTASAVTGINDGAGFASTDVGRLIRIKQGSVWGYVQITAYTSTTVVTVTVINTITSTAAKATWRMGLYSATSGYPGAVTFHEDRLCFGGNTYQPQRFDGSNSSDYENFAPTATDGTIASSNALGFSLNANDVNVIRWMASDEKGLLIGTVGGEWIVRPSSQSEALSPTNVTAKRSSSWGSANIQPAASGKAHLFVQSSGLKIREMSYFYDVDGFQSPDMTQLAEHITKSGLVELAYQKEPQSIVWGCRADGVLVGMSYERDMDSLKVGWSRHIVGGYSDAANSDAIVESVAVIPSSDGTRDELWMIVKRYINGRTVRYIEYMKKMFQQSDDQQDAYFVDCGLTYDDPVTISGATAANPVVVTATSHGYSNGDKVQILNIKGMTQLNTGTYLVANKTANTFELTTIAGANVNGTSYTAYVSGGEVRKMVLTVSGLSHLEGQSVAILADGAAQPAATVSGGSVTLTTRAATVQIGLSYNSDAQLLRPEAGAADGTALGKLRRVSVVSFQLYRSLGLKIGVDLDDLDTLVFRKSSDPLTRAVPLYTGMITEHLEADYDTDNQLCWRQDQPLPSMILSVSYQMVTQDRN
ncbi:phage stabilization protein [Caudoviricetes sp.]|nr:phage stabilization protein [Caudoviricetes sp.]